jgi:hypothetical protein
VQALNQSRHGLQEYIIRMPRIEPIREEKANSPTNEAYEILLRPFHQIDVAAVLVMLEPV